MNTKNTELRMLSESQDAFGRAYEDAYSGGAGFLIIERDDGLEGSFSCSVYFGDFEDWAPQEQKSMEWVRGRVLDIGCGPGRHALYLQNKGYQVTGIDNSPVAIRIASERGLLDARVMGIDEITPEIGIFDTILALGNNFGLIGKPESAKKYLDLFNKITSSEGRIVAGCRDPYKTDNPRHILYHQRNIKAGRMAGLIRIRAKSGNAVGPWMDLLLMSKNELDELLKDTAWVVTNTIGDSSYYVALIEKRSS